jgi:hypothetical protein
MYPVLFRIGNFEVTSFGVMVALAALVGLWLFRRELRRSGLPLDATDAGLVGVVGGLTGAKLLWTIEHATEAPLLELLLSRGSFVDARIPIDAHRETSQRTRTSAAQNCVETV